MVLVTGATGFIGAELTRRLVAQGEQVRILRRASSRLDLLGDADRYVDQVVGDVTDPDSLRDAMRGIRHVYHTAAYVGMGGRSERDVLFRVNVAGTAHVVDAALAEGVERLVHTSSIAAMGRPDEETSGMIDEAAPWVESRAITEYGRSKVQSEREVYRAIAEGLDAVLVNPSLVFGVGRPGENTREMVDRVRRRRMPAFPAGGTNVVDVEDVADGHLRAMLHGRTGERYFLGSENLSWQEIFGTIAGAFGVEPPRRKVPPVVLLAAGAVAEAWSALTRTRPRLTSATARGTSRFYRFSNRKAVEELGCKFRPFEETAARMAREIGAR
jgi:dihydroflavonol-4-reductase